MAWIAAHDAHRNLMRAPVALFPLAVDLFGAGPALGRAQTIIGQIGRFENPFFRASSWMLRISPITVSSADAMSSCMTAGSSPSTK